MDQGVLIVTVIFAIGLGFVFMNLYNGLIFLRAQLERAWSNIDVILKQRYDEIPQLIQVVEQFTNYEASVLKSLVEARTRYGSARSVEEKIDASQQLSLALGGVLALGEAYPELKSNQNFMHLQKRVSELENTISDRRESYNDAVANFNTRIEQFPHLFAAKFLNYKRQKHFEAAEVERTTPSLKMNLPKVG